ncbi:very short patch repair endonuclease [Nocardia suismassiliense]|uniref:very short patch repair endonuclease n=1 Tax=Nocardia suismassiliense TaxID=2077092 RepID=UPI002277734F|nr:very short patch repair endonuclease [Nocardia suismassiliense]
MNDSRDGLDDAPGDAQEQSSDLRPVGRAPRPTTDAATSARMARQRRSGTKPELALRRELHRRGVRYFVDRAPLRGQRRRADLVFPRLRVAVYVDGCFWHRCPQHATDPRNNAQWWADKLAGNVARDRATDAALTAAGWQVVRVWEHEDAVAAADRVQAALRHRPSGT